MERLYNVQEYLLSRIIIQFIVITGESLIATLIFSWFNIAGSGIITDSLILDIFITIELTIASSAALGMLLGLFVKSVSNALTILPPVFTSQLVLSETIFQIPKCLKCVSQFISAKHSMAALGSLLNINKYPTAISLKYPGIIPVVTNELFESSSGHVFNCWCYLITLTIIPLILAYFVLIYRTNKKE